MHYRFAVAAAIASSPYRISSSKLSKSEMINSDRGWCQLRCPEFFESKNSQQRTNDLLRLFVGYPMSTIFDNISHRSDFGAYEAVRAFLISPGMHGNAPGPN